MAISNATKLAGYVGAAITGDGATGIITAITFSGTATNAANLGIGATGYGLVLSGDLTAANVTVGGTLTYDDVTNIDSIGLITARSGVSIGDSIFHTGDSNTAIRFPQSDTFTVETGGSERVRVDSSGRTTAGGESATASGPQYSKLQVLGNSYSANNSALFSLRRDEVFGDITEGEDLGVIHFADRTGNTFAEIHGECDGSTGSSDYPGRLSFHTTADGGSSTTERLRITSGGGFHFTNGELIERAKVTAGKLSDNTNIDLENGMVHLFTTQETTTSTPNIRINSSTSLNSVMAIGEMISVTLITTAAAGAYSAQLTIDGSAVTENWTGGSAPSDGGSSGVDIHAYTIIKTADATFTVVATQTKTS